MSRAFFYILFSPIRRMKNEVVIFLLCAAAIQGERMKNLKLFAEWKDLEFAFPTQAHRQAAIGNGEYISGRGVPIDVDIDYRAHGLTRVFVTIPRFTTGIPVTLGVITPAEANGGPIIQPFPYYELQNMYARSCDGITSVFRVKVGLREDLSLFMSKSIHVCYDIHTFFNHIRLMNADDSGYSTRAELENVNIVHRNYWFTIWIMMHWFTVISSRRINSIRESHYSSRLWWTYSIHHPAVNV